MEESKIKMRMEEEGERTRKNKGGVGEKRVRRKKEYCGGQDKLEK